jgi:hypothetical protein
MVQHQPRENSDNVDEELLQLLANLTKKKEKDNRISRVRSNFFDFCTHVFSKLPFINLYSHDQFLCTSDVLTESVLEEISSTIFLILFDDKSITIGDRVVNKKCMEIFLIN